MDGTSPIRFGLQVALVTKSPAVATACDWPRHCGLLQTPVFFRLQEGGLRHGRQIPLGRILTKRCKPDGSQQEQGKSQMALHLNEPTTMVSTVAHADGQGFLGLVVITAHLAHPLPIQQRLQGMSEMPKKGRSSAIPLFYSTLIKLKIANNFIKFALYHLLRQDYFRRD